MSSSDALLRMPLVSERRFQLGLPGGGLERDDAGHIPTAEEIEALVSDRVRDIDARFERERQDVYQSGLADGVRQATEEASGRIERLGALFRGYLQQVVSARDEWLTASVGQVTELALAVVERVLEDRPARAETIERAVLGAVKRLVGGDRITIRCHPDDAAFVRELLGSAVEELARFERVEIAEDSAVGVGGCVVETELGVVDARVEKQLAVLRGALRDDG